MRLAIAEFMTIENSLLRFSRSTAQLQRKTEMIELVVSFQKVIQQPPCLQFLMKEEAKLENERQRSLREVVRVVLHKISYRKTWYRMWKISE